MSSTQNKDAQRLQSRKVFVCRHCVLFVRSKGHVVSICFQLSKFFMSFCEGCASEFAKFAQSVERFGFNGESFLFQ